MKPVDICVITSCDAFGDHVTTANEALAGGATLIQLRDKKLDTDAVLNVACKIMELKKSFHFTFIVNDSVEVALKSDADGVHLGQEDDQISFAREVLGEGKLIGISTHSLEEARKAVTAGADYIGFGPMFETMSKDSTYTPRSRDEFRRIVQEITVPIFVIGGVTRERFRELLIAPHVGAAVIGAVRSGNMRRSVEGLLEECQALRATH